MEKLKDLFKKDSSKLMGLLIALDGAWVTYEQTFGTDGLPTIVVVGLNVVLGGAALWNSMRPQANIASYDPTKFKLVPIDD